MGIGMDSAAKAVERSEQRSGSGDYLPMIYWKDDKKGEGKEFKKVLRFITDDVITCGFYEFVKGGPVGDGGKQKGRDFIAPGTLVDDDGKPIYKELAGEKDYFIAHNVLLPDFKQNMRSPKDSVKEKTVALAVIREEYSDTVDGRRVSRVRDHIEHREWETADGEKKSEDGVVIGLVKQGHKNFWATLVGYYSRFGTICDRDYEVTRVGNGTDTSYVIIPLERDMTDPELSDPKVVAEKYVPPVSFKDWVISKARYAEAQSWLEGSGKSAESSQSEGNSPSATASSDGGTEPINAPSGDGAQTLAEELRSFANTK